eukprot:13942783-Ditylum_brightwellii.AAC.1
MPCLHPLRTYLGNLNHKGGHAKGDPPKKWCGTEGSKEGAPLPVFGGEGCQPALHIDNRNASFDV